MDYSEYGIKSEEWLAVEGSLPIPPSGLSRAELKKVTNGMRVEAARQQMKELSSKVTLKDLIIPTRDNSSIPARVYRSSSVNSTKLLPIYLHFHGGGFFFGSLESEDATCSRIAIEGDVVVVHANYRHTPEFVYPTAWLDAEDALACIVQQASEFAGDNTRIVVGGISAGAYLTSSLMLTLHREQNPLRDRILGQVLMIPPAVHMEHAEEYTKLLRNPSLSSLKQNEFAPLLPISRVRFFNEMLFLGPTLAEDHRANPGLQPDLVSLPPSTFGICGLDPLRDEGLIFAEMVHSTGVPTDVHLFKGIDMYKYLNHGNHGLTLRVCCIGLPHGFRGLGNKLPNSSRAWDSVLLNGIKWSLSKPAASSDFDIHVH